MLGTIVNVVAVVFGSLIGLLLKSRIPEKLHQLIFDAMGLFTVLLGIKMAFKSQEILVLLISLLLGSVIGELIDFDFRLENLGKYIKNKLNVKEKSFTDGLVSSFLLFCIGPLTILGCIEEGLGQYPSQLYTKATMDGFSSIALSSALGVGVLVSAIPLLVFQGVITFSATLQPYVTDTILTELTATGGIMIIALGLNILELKKIKVANMLPALLFSALITYCFING